MSVTDGAVTSDSISKTKAWRVNSWHLGASSELALYTETSNRKKKEKKRKNTTQNLYKDARGKGKKNNNSGPESCPRKNFLMAATAAVKLMHSYDCSHLPTDRLSWTERRILLFNALFFLKKSFAPKLASPQHMPVSTPVPEAVREGIAATAGELKPPGNG